MFLYVQQFLFGLPQIAFTNRMTALEFGRELLIVTTGLSQNYKTACVGCRTEHVFYKMFVHELESLISSY